MNYILFKNTGQIISCITTEPHDVGINVQANNADGFIEGEVADTSQYYVDNAVLIKKPEALSKEHKFDYATKQWVDPRTLRDFKDEQWLLIKKAREAAINAPLATPYGSFDSDATGRTSITDAVLMLQTMSYMGTPTTLDFTLADNTVVTLSTLQMVEVGLLLGQKTQAAYRQARIKRDEIEAATTKEAVLLIGW